MRVYTAALLVLSSACTSSGTGSLPPASAPGPFLLQYVGEYDDPSGGAFSRVVLHADGTLEASTGGETVDGIFIGSGRPGDASASAQTQDGRSFTISFQSTPATDAPAQVQATIAFHEGSASAQTLVGLWVAGSESMCDATGGTWRDDDPDAKTGLYCICAASDVFVPSRGGCVESNGSHADPDRRRPSDSAQDHAGSYDGIGSVSSLNVSRDGTYDATVDGRHDEGTWWDAPSLTGSGATIDCTGAARAFRAIFQSDGTVTLHLGNGVTESLRTGH
jgi:hypothetical protein